jgi:PAS domain S-box-containing protein
MEESSAHEIPVAELVRQLIETESALERAFSGQIDAVIDPVGATPFLLRQAQQALQQKEKSLRLLLEQLPAIVWSTDTDLTITGCQGSHLARIGMNPQDIVGQRLGDLVARDCAALLVHHHRQALHGESTAYELDILGSVYQGHAEPLCDANGAICGVVGMLLDISERKAAEKEMAQRNRELSLLNAITAAATSTLNLEEMLNTLTRVLSAAEGVPGGILLLCDWPGTEPCAGIQWRVSDEVADSLREAASRYCGQIAAGATSDAQSVLCPASPNGAGSHTCLMLSLMAKGDVQGVLCFVDEDRCATDHARARFYEMLAWQVGVAVQNARLFEQVRIGRHRLQSLSHRLVETQEAERRFIARELHDEVGQVLTGLNIILEMAKRMPAETIRASLEEAQGRVYELVDQVRRLSLDLRPPMLDDLGLSSALRWHFERYTTQTGIVIHFDHNDVEFIARPEAALAVYRIIQEALTNVARHAHASEVWVSLHLVDDQVELTIVDQGDGFDPQIAMAANTSIGLVGMTERVALLGGHITIHSHPGQGTRLQAVFPLCSGLGAD